MIKTLLSFFLLFSGNASDLKKKGKIESLFNKYKGKFSSVRNIDVNEYLKMKAKNSPLLIDVRDKKEREVSIIPGAIDLETFEKQQNNYKGRALVLYCTIGVRSGLEAKKLQGQGFETYNLKGSILSWAHAGLDFEHEGIKTKRAHTYNRDWNFLPDGYEAIY